MENLKEFINRIKNARIHIVGVSGSEGSSILNFLVDNNISQITAHDFVATENLEKNFKIWHKGIESKKRNKLFKEFQCNLEKTRFCDRKKYLENIEEAQVVFLAQSWRLYPQNQPLKFLKDKIPFYSLTRLYLDFAPAAIIAVTGTVGKGSCASLISEILSHGNKKVYFAGNESWRIQLADKFNLMNPTDVLVIEVSHRQLSEGFTKAPQTLLMTNLFPNHLDEMSWPDYVKLKMSLALAQGKENRTIINYDNLELRQQTQNLNSQRFYYSLKEKNMNIKSVRNIYDELMNIKSVHYPENILAVSTVAKILDINDKTIIETIAKSEGLPARIQEIGNYQGTKFIDDIKSTTPWATLAALKKFKLPLVLIAGGDTKGIEANTLWDFVQKNKIEIVFMDSPLSKEAENKLPALSRQRTDSLEEALKLALNKTPPGGTVLVSPAAANFYSRFIKGKKSLRKIITSLLPEAKATKGPEK